MMTLTTATNEATNVGANGNSADIDDAAKKNPFKFNGTIINRSGEFVITKILLRMLI